MNGYASWMNLRWLMQLCVHEAMALNLPPLSLLVRLDGVRWVMPLQRKGAQAARRRATADEVAAAAAELAVADVWAAKAQRFAHCFAAAG